MGSATPKHPLHEVIPCTPPAQVTTPVLDDDYMQQTTPSPKVSPAFRRLHKALELQVSMSSIPKEDVQQTSSVARQVFPEVIPSTSAHESEAKVAEDILAASADKEKEEEREVIPPASDLVVQEENVIVPDTPVNEAMEVEINEASTTITIKANDIVMAKAMWIPKSMLPLKTLCSQPHPM